jgi:glycosyltransferase involved in cell wall biosynthesis
VVVTNYGACLDFCTEDNALFVPSAVAPLEVYDLGPSSIGYWWAEPDGAVLGRILRQVVDDPRATEGLGRAGRARIVADFSWDTVAALAEARLLALATAGR